MDGKSVGLVVVDLASEVGQSKAPLGWDHLAAMRVIAREEGVAIIALVQLPASEFPLQVKDSEIFSDGTLTEEEAKDIYRFQLDPLWGPQSEVVPGAPVGVEQSADVLMLLQWSINIQTGLAHLI